MNATDAIVFFSVISLLALLMYLVVSHQRLLEAHCLLRGKFEMLLAQMEDRLHEQRAAAANGGGKRVEIVRVPPVLISREVLGALAAGINHDRRARPGVEHGFALVGRIDGDAERRKIIVNGLIAAGEKATKYSGEIQFDRDFQQRELEKFQLIDPRASHIGDAHLHPGSLDRCSSGDLKTDRANVLASNTKEMVFVIATVAREHGFEAEIDPNSVYVEGLKLDFFYMGAASRYHYVKFKPRGIDEPALTLPAVVDQLLARDPSRAKLDLAMLFALPQFSVRVTELHGLPCVELAHRQEGWKAMIVLEESAEAAPHVYVERGGELEQFQPPFLDGGWTRHIWLTEIALAVEEEMKGRNGSRIGAFADGGRIDVGDAF